MKHIKTVCPRDCYDSCALIAHVDNNEKIISVKPDNSNPITQNFTCPRASKDHERVYKNRIKTPLIKQNNQFEKVEWETALKNISIKLTEAIQKYGNESVLLIEYAGNQGLLTTAYPQRLWNRIGATQTDGAVCTKSGHVALNLHYGSSHGMKPEKLKNKNLVVFWGFNAFVSAPHFWKLANQAKKERYTKIIVIDPIKSESAEKADLWIAPYPNTDTALAYGIINYLIQNELVDEKFIAKKTIGYERLIKEAKKFTLVKTAKITGISTENIELLAKYYAGMPKSATMIGVSLQKAENGIQPVRAISLIPAILGQKRGFFYSNGKSFLIDESYINGSKFIKQHPKIVKQVALAEYINRGNFKFIYIHSMNPAETLPDVEKFINGLKRNDVFVVVHDTHYNKTTELADVVLPAASYLEKNDVIPPWGHNYIRYSKKAIEPLFESKTEVEVMWELAKKMNFEEKWLFENPQNAIEMGFKNAIKKNKSLVNSNGKILKLKAKRNGKYPTPSGKIELYSSIAEKSGIYPLPEYVENKLDDNEFFLISGALAKYTNSQFQDIYGKVPSYVLINSKDAEKLEIKNEEIIILKNENAELKIKAIVTEDISQKTIWSPRICVSEDKISLNSLTAGIPQKIGSGSKFNSTKIKIQKIK